MRLDDLTKNDTKWSDLSDEVLKLIADKFAVGPRYKRTKPKTHICENCGKDAAYYRENHADTGMDETVLYCPECKHSKELK